MRGIIYVAFGERARTEARQSMKTLNCYHDIPVAVIADRPLEGATYIPFDDAGNGARRAKLSIPEVAPAGWTHILYLDADTRIRGNLEGGFKPVEDEWDIAITPSTKQIRDELLWHIGDKEREYTYQEINNSLPLQLQGGVWWINRQRCKGLFREWLSEWERWGDQDQGALLRAIQKKPVRIWLMGRPFNDGYLVEHRYGMAVN